MPAWSRQHRVIALCPAGIRHNPWDSMGCQSLRGAKTSSTRITLLVWHSSIHCIQEASNGHSSVVPPGILCQSVDLNIIFDGLPRNCVETCMVLQRVKPTDFHKTPDFSCNATMPLMVPRGWTLMTLAIRDFSSSTNNEWRIFWSRDISQHLLDGIHGVQIVYVNDCSKIKENSKWEKSEKVCKTPNDFEWNVSSTMGRTGTHSDDKLRCLWCPFHFPLSKALFTRSDFTDAICTNF